MRQKMSEVQAKETKIEIEVEAVDPTFTIEPEVEDESEAIELAVESTDTEGEVLDIDEDGPIKIEVEEAGKPPARRLSRFDKRLKNVKADAEAESEALREQLKLYQLRDKQEAQKASAPIEPDYDTFEGSDAEFKTAQRAYNQAEIKRIAGEEAYKLVQHTTQQTAQTTQDTQTDEIRREHYKRADTLKVSNYDELEGSAVDIIGEDFANVLMASSDNAHLILASMGANPNLAAEIAKLAKTNPSKAFANALTFKIHPSLKPASKKTLDPETAVDPGRGVSKSNSVHGVTFS
jgi:hypothetical protein